MTSNRKFKLSPVSAAVASALLVGAADQSALAQDDEIEEVVVVGIRGSLVNSMNTKRNSTGVVDAIVAEDIGKFPDTNLAESMQRITGVSIDRLNGEGNQVTVRGFGPGYNLVTLNGRTIPTAEVPLIGAQNAYVGAQGRSFDFSNIASEGVSSMEVIKTGSATLPSGGLGATVNINTLRPLDGGAQGTFGVKALADSSVSAGSSVTPELSGLYSWVNDEESFGVSVFASYSERDSGGASGYINDYYYGRGPGVDSVFLRGDGSTVVTNAPTDGQLWFIPQDSRNDFSDLSRERLNAQLTVQFRPTDSLTLTADYLMIDNTQEELRYEQTNWYARPMDEIVFDNTGAVAIPTYMQENNNGEKDVGFEQQNRRQQDTMDSLGLNVEWDLGDAATLRFDAHTSNGKTEPDNRLGHGGTAAAIAAPVVVQHSTDYATDLPEQSYTFDDSFAGNGNGVLDAGDLASQPFRSWSNWQEMDVDEFDLRYSLEGDNARLDVGVNYRGTEIYQRGRSTQLDLGSWGMAYKQDVEQYAPGVVESFCMACEFDDFPGGDTEVAFRSDATQLYEIMVPIYLEQGQSMTVNDSQNWLEEDITSFYAQFSTDTEFMGLGLQINGGLRYEQTDVSAVADQAVPTNLLWTADNDFLVEYSGTQNVQGEGDYNHLLPNIDFRLDISDELVARLSYSQTIGRAPFGNLFAATTVGGTGPNSPTALGGVATGNSQDPSLVPLESENFDLSVEWYYGDGSYVSVGYFDKDVKNFIGTGVVNRNLFGLKDPTSGAAGTRSGNALDFLSGAGYDQSDANLFTLVALIDANGGDLAAAQSEFEANIDPNTNQLPQTYVDEILAEYDVEADAVDPELIFRVTQPVNQEDGSINGWELAWQHFFGDSGFGFAANYTMAAADYLKAFYQGRKVLAFIARPEAKGRFAYTDEYGQIDASVSYDLNDNIQFTFEGINLNGENTRQYRRIPGMTLWGYEYEPRYSFGARYRF
ncbi:MAG: TonB-dependent receptor [Woeseiaceae bacterium]